jgi:hypothetical protein
MPSRRRGTFAAMRRSLVAAAVLATAGVLTAVALAARTAVSLSVTPSVVHRGQIVTVDGNADGCSVGNTVFVISRAFAGPHEFAGVPAVVPKVRSGGSFHANARIRRHPHARRFVITARCGGGNLGVAAHLTVLP